MAELEVSSMIGEEVIFEDDRGGGAGSLCVPESWPAAISAAEVWAAEGWGALTGCGTVAALDLLSFP